MNRNQTLRVLITGANGFVGRNVAALFAKKGIQVISITRNRENAQTRTIISKDLSEKHLVSKLRKCSVLLHFIGKGRQTVDDDYEKVNVGLTKNAITLCQKAGIKKIIYISGLGVHKNTNFGYFISKYKAEQEIIHSGLDYTIFRASYIIGKNDPLSQILFKQIKKNKIIIPGSGNYRLQPISVDDVGTILLKSITDKKFTNKIIDLVGPQTVTYKCFIKDFLHEKKIKIEKIDLEDAYRNSLRKKNNDFGIDDLSILVGDFVGNYKKLKKITGIKFRTYREVLKACRFS
jgi:NADH dehydrogenase